VEETFVEDSYTEDSAASLGSRDASTASVGLEDVGIEKAQEFAEGFEPDPLAIAAKPLTEGEVGSFEEAAPGTIELAADVTLGLPDDAGSDSTFTSEEESPVDGLETFESGFIVGQSSADATDSLATESFFDSTNNLEASSDEALLDSFVEDSDAVTGTSAFSQVRDDTTDSHPSEFPAEQLVELSTASEALDADISRDEALVARAFEMDPGTQISDAPTTPFAPFPEAPLSPTGTSGLHETLPDSTQGDPLLAPAFGAEQRDTGSADDEWTHTTDEPFATPDTAEADAHVPVAEASGSEPGAFVTETMATLYLEQGHFDAALDIYRQLVQQRPDDIALRDRLHAAEERAWGHQRDLGESILDDDAVSSTLFDESQEDVVPQPHSYGGPTIREFLTGILYPRSVTPVDGSAVSPESEDVYPHIESPTHADEDAATADSPAPATASPASLRSTPVTSPGDSVSSSLGALFSEADAATAKPDASDAGSLGADVATPIGGTPAHRAPTELSLDHVFKSNTSRAPDKDAFSFDQFFSEGAAEQSTASAEPASEPRAETGDDIAQFNAWLNGLKKS